MNDNLLSTRFGVDPDVFVRYPGYRRGVIVVQAAHNVGSPPELVAMIRDEEGRLRQDLGLDGLASEPRIAAWREAYRAFGARPSEFRSSIEALLRRVVKGEALPLINALVNVGTLASLRYRLPVGVHPLDEQAEPLVLRVSRTEDTFVPPDRGITQRPAPGEIVFAQGQTVLTRRWTWRQAAGTRIDLDTSEAFFNVDALAAVSDAEFEGAIALIPDAMSRFAIAHDPALVLIQAPRPV